MEDVTSAKRNGNPLERISLREAAEADISPVALDVSGKGALAENPAPHVVISPFGPGRNRRIVVPVVAEEEK